MVFDLKALIGSTPAVRPVPQEHRNPPDDLFD